MNGARSPKGREMRWPFAPLPRNDELLSSYLCRIAAAHGATPMRFTGLHLGEHIWTRDIDRTPPRGLTEAVACGAGLSESRVRAMQLTAPLGWVSCVGVYHRMRRRHGLRYCPACLQEEAAYLRQWRCAWVTCCWRHGLWLWDSCPACGAVLMLHRAAALNRCWRCAADLTHAPRRAVPMSDAPWQARLTLAVEDGSWGAAFLQSTRLIEMALQRLPAARKAALPAVLAYALELPQPSLSRVEHAALHARLAKWVCVGWPASFRLAAEYGRWSQQTFASLARRAPRSFQEQYARLCPGTSRARSGSRHPLRVQLCRLKRVKAQDWRTRRAELLLAAAERISRGH